jgi:hypothetical protein
MAGGGGRPLPGQVPAHLRGHPLLDGPRGHGTGIRGMRAYHGRGAPYKGVGGPSTTLAWPGRKQPDIPVEVVDTPRLETSRFKNGFAIVVLQYYPSTEFKSAFNVY